MRHLVPPRLPQLLDDTCRRVVLRDQLVRLSQPQPRHGRQVVAAGQDAEMAEAIGRPADKAHGIDRGEIVEADRLAEAIAIELEDHVAAAKDEEVRVFGDDGGHVLVLVEEGELRVGFVGGDHVLDIERAEFLDELERHPGGDIDGFFVVFFGEGEIAGAIVMEGFFAGAAAGGAAIGFGAGLGGEGGAIKDDDGADVVVEKSDNALHAIVHIPKGWHRQQHQNGHGKREKAYRRVGTPRPRSRAHEMTALCSQQYASTATRWPA